MVAVWLLETTAGGVAGPNATAYWVALVDAAQLRVAVTATPVALLTGAGVAGMVGSARVVKLQSGPLVDPLAPLATTCQ